MNNTTESNQPTISLPPLTDLPEPLPLYLPLPNWLLAVLLVSAISNRLYQVSLVVLSIVRMWKKSTTEQNQTE